MLTDALAKLTSAEAVVASGICRGESNEVIARRRGTSPRTVANQVASIFRKCGVGSRAELVARYGVLSAPPPSTEQELTRQEREVVERAAKGEPNKVIGYDLGLSPSTVSGHLAKAAAKLGVRSRVELIAIMGQLTATASDRRTAVDRR